MAGRIAVLFALAVAARAETVVGPGGAIGAAIEAAAPGSVIRIRKGVYREYLRITKPVSLVGEEGAVIDPSEPLPVKWEAAAEFGSGVYKAVLEREPAALYIDGQVLAQVDPKRRMAARPGPWNWRKLIAAGTPRTGFRMVRGLWLYLPEAKTALLHLENDAAPCGHRWSVVWTMDPVITIRETKDVKVSGLTVAHGSSGVYIVGGAERTVVEKCRIGPWDRYGVLVKDGAAGTLVEGNEIFRGSYESMTPQTEIKADGDMVISPDWYEIWRVHKETGYFDRVGISLTLSGFGNRLHANHIHDVFDGIDLGEGEIETLSVPLADSSHDRGAEISGNVIERTGDSGMEVGGPAVDVRIHHNTLRQAHGGLRFKLPRVGPVFIYCNRLLDGRPFNIWYSMDASPAEGYVYNNTVIGGRAGLMYHHWPKDRGYGAPRWHYVNNSFTTWRGGFLPEGREVPVDFTWTSNVVKGEGSKAVRFVDLSSYFHGTPLPGCGGCKR